MAKQIPVVNIATDTFTTFINRTNELITTVNTEVITANSSPSGALTVGNTYLAGIFSANVVTSNGALRGGNVSTVSPLQIISNVIVNNFSLFVSNTLSNSTISPNSLTFANSSKVSTVSLALINYGNSSSNSSLFSNGLFEISNNSLVVKTDISNAAVNSSSLLISNSIVSSLFSLSEISVGNSTVNTTIEQGSVLVGPYVSLIQSGLLIGNSTVNSSLNSTALFVGSNASLKSTGLYVGNSTVNTSITPTNIITSDIDSTIANVVSATIEILTVNNILTSSAFVVGNTTINHNYITIGNTTVNASMNSSSLAVSNTSGTFLVGFGDTFSNAVFNSRFWFTNTTTTGTSTQTIDFFDKNDYRSVEYLVSVKNTEANGYATTKAICMHDGGSAFVTEYGHLYSNTNLGNFSATTNSTHVMFQFTPTPANTRITLVRTSLGI